MELSIFLAKAWGLYVVLACLALLINKSSLRSLVNTMNNDSAVILTGALSLILGVLSVLVHNIWSGPAFVIVVTVFGWLALLKGFVRMAWPSHTRKMFDDMMQGSTANILLVIALVVGAYLLYAGFTA